MNESKNKSKLEKLIECEKWISIASAIFIIGAFVIMLGLAIFTKITNEEILFKLLPTLLIVPAILVLLILPKISKLVLEEKINQLNDVDFKAIKLKGTDILSKQLLKGSKVEAKIHESNNNLIVIKISFSDQKPVDAFVKECIFTRDDIKKILEDIEN